MTYCYTREVVRPGQPSLVTTVESCARTRDELERWVAGWNRSELEHCARQQTPPRFIYRVL